MSEKRITRSRTSANRTQPNYRSCICEECGKVLCTEAQVKKHQRKIHGKGTFICDICNIGFKTSTLLQRHHQLKHPVPKITCKCTKCQKIFHSLRVYRSHTLNHQYNEGNCIKQLNGFQIKVEPHQATASITPPAVPVTPTKSVAPPSQIQPTSSAVSTSSTATVSGPQPQQPIRTSKMRQIVPNTGPTLRFAGAIRLPQPPPRPGSLRQHPMPTFLGPEVPRYCPRCNIFLVLSAKEFREHEMGHQQQTNGGAPPPRGPPPGLPITSTSTSFIPPQPVAGPSSVRPVFAGTQVRRGRPPNVIQVRPPAPPAFFQPMQHSTPLPPTAQSRYHNFVQQQQPVVSRPISTSRGGPIIPLQFNPNFRAPGPSSVPAVSLNAQSSPRCKRQQPQQGDTATKKITTAQAEAGFKTIPIVAVVNNKTPPSTSSSLASGQFKCSMCPFTAVASDFRAIREHGQFHEAAASVRVQAFPGQQQQLNGSTPQRPPVPPPPARPQIRPMPPTAGPRIAPGQPNQPNTMPLQIPKPPPEVITIDDDDDEEEDGQPSQSEKSVAAVVNTTPMQTTSNASSPTKNKSTTPANNTPTKAIKREVNRRTYWRCTICELRTACSKKMRDHVAAKHPGLRNIVVKVFMASRKRPNGTPTEVCLKKRKKKPTTAISPAAAKAKAASASTEPIEVIELD